MNPRKAFYLIFSLVLTSAIAIGQQTAPAPKAPAAPPAPMQPGDAPMAFSMFFEGGSFLGVHTEDINSENMARYGMREARGVGITEVVKDSPAEKAGLRKDDVIVKFEGDNVTSVRKLTRLVSEVAPDQTARLLISRGGSEQEIAVTIGKRDNSMNAFHRLEGLKDFKDLKDFKSLEDFKGLEELKGLGALKGNDRYKELLKEFPKGGPNVWKWEGPGSGESFVYSFGNHRRIGVSTMELTKQLADYFGIDDGQGVLVTSVADDSPAAKAGIKAGDIITSVDGEKVDGSGDLSRAINKKKDGDVTMTVIRKGNQRTVTVTPKEAPAVQPGVAPRAGARTIVIPRVEMGTIPSVNVVTPQITLPIIPEIRVNIGDGSKPRVIRTRTTQPI